MYHVTFTYGSAHSQMAFGWLVQGPRAMYDTQMGCGYCAITLGAPSKRIAARNFWRTRHFFKYKFRRLWRTCHIFIYDVA